MFSKKDEPAQQTPEPKPEFPVDGGHGQGTESGYTVEARSMFKDPQPFGKQIFDQRWRKVQFDQVEPPFGVPSGHSIMAVRLGLYSYAQAQALRWWFHANAWTTFSGFCLESRIVAHKVTYSYSEQAVSAHDVISGEDRSNTMPDWGKSEQAASTTTRSE